ncbi:MAG: copper homeostasis protein CutC [Bacteroidetes bacterium]|nr:copper homeostasis protein CutC [Bacteroidota bacterium]
MNKSIILENAVFNLESALNAQLAGADRIELCDNPAEGGTTPSFGVLERARKLLNIDVFAMIRPRGGDFVYSDYEFEAMKADIMTCKRLGMDGVVLGILRSDGSMDTDRCKELIQVASPMPVTCHRAFDLTPHAEAALHDCIQAGFSRILTSGRAATAEDGIETLRGLVKLADGNIVIMAGVGVHAGNVKKIVEETGVSEIHFSARTYRDSDAERHNHRISLLDQLPSDSGVFICDPEKIKAVRKALETN